MAASFLNKAVLGISNLNSESTLSSGFTVPLLLTKLISTGTVTFLVGYTLRVSPLRSSILALSSLPA